MIINPHIITYLVCLAMSFCIGLVAGLNGFSIWKNWDIKSDAEDQYRLEKKVYLIITVLFLGFCLRLFMFPLWFFSLHTMIPSVPGAMCLVGIHNINSPVSYVASGFKLVMPVFYVYWLILNLLDRGIETQPFMKHKLWLLTPLGTLIIIETIMDAWFLFSVPPRQVSCCTSLFDVPRNDLLQIVSESSWLWVVVFYTLALILLGEMAYFFRAQTKSMHTGNGWWFGKKSFMLMETVFIILIFITFIFSLHTKISPLFLGLPFHHCIFCLCQQVWDTLCSFFMIFAGMSFFLVYFWIVSSVDYMPLNQRCGVFMKKLLQWAGGLFLSGFIILTLHLFLVLF